MFNFSKSRSRNVTMQLFYTNTMRLIVNPLCIVVALFSSSKFIQWVNAMQPSVDIITMNFWRKTFAKDNYFDSSEIITTPPFYFIFWITQTLRTLIFVLKLITLEHIYICTRTNVYLFVLMLGNYKVYYNNLNNSILY